MRSLLPRASGASLLSRMMRGLDACRDLHERWNVLWGGTAFGRWFHSDFGQSLVRLPGGAPYGDSPSITCIVSPAGWLLAAAFRGGFGNDQRQALPRQGAVSDGGCSC